MEFSEFYRLLLELEGKYGVFAALCQSKTSNKSAFFQLRPMTLSSERHDGI
jgi:hypothetical protein